MKRLSCIFLILFLIASSAIPVKADVGSLTIDLSSAIGTGGLSNGGFSEMLPGIGALVSLGLMAAEIDVYLEEKSISEYGTTHTDYVIKQFTDWVNTTSLSYDNVAKTFQEGMEFAENGYIYFGNEVADIIRQFGNWICSNENDNFYSTVKEDNDYVSLNGADVAVKVSAGDAFAYRYSSYTNRFIVVTASEDVYLTSFSSQNKGRYHLLVMSDKPNTTFSYKVVLGVNGSTTSTFSFPLSEQAGNYYLPAQDQMNNNTTAYAPIDGIPCIYHGGNKANCYTYISNLGVWEPSAAPLPEKDTFIGDVADWVDFIPGLALPEGYSGAIDPGILDDLQGEIGSIGDAVITLEDYIEAITDMIDGTGEEVKVYPDATGAEVTIPFPDVVTPDPAYEQVQDEDIPEEKAKPYAPDLPATPAAVLEQPLTLGLKDIFPFCIPFDIYDMLSKFDVPAEAPHLSIDYTFPMVNVRWQYEVDFSPFNTVAAVLRTMELIAAVVGLALATRAIYLRS